MEFPLILPGIMGGVAVDTLSVVIPEVPQDPIAFTVIVPPVEIEVAMIEFVVELPLHPDGNVQLYDVTPATELTLNVFVLLLQTVAFPVIEDGALGMLPDDTLNVLGLEDPQAFTAVIEILPLDELAVTLIEFVFELPVHPDGKVQVYDVAPDTAVTLYVFELLRQTEVLPLIEGGVDGIVQDIFWTMIVPFWL